MSMRDLISVTPSATHGELKQQLRLRRFLQASIFSVLYLIVLTIFYTQNKVDRATLFEAFAIVATVIFGFFVVFRMGLNLRFSDPSLTVLQLLAAVFTMLFIVYRAPDTRLSFPAFFFVAFMFGMLRCSGTKLAVLGLVSLAALAIVIWRRYSDNHDGEMLRLDVLQFVVIAITFPWFVFIGGRVKQLQRDLLEVNIKLEDIEEKARHDDLTGVYNRRALMVAMEESEQRANATGEPLSICVIDLDLFKRYNDEFDHLSGDRDLQRCSRAARDGPDSTDVSG